MLRGNVWKSICISVIIPSVDPFVDDEDRALATLP
jgi:hypothetical protein